MQNQKGLDQPSSLTRAAKGGAPICERRRWPYQRPPPTPSCTHCAPCPPRRSRPGRRPSAAGSVPGRARCLAWAARATPEGPQTWSPWLGPAAAGTGPAERRVCLSWRRQHGRGLLQCKLPPLLFFIPPGGTLVQLWATDASNTQGADCSRRGFCSASCVRACAELIADGAQRVMILPSQV